MLCKRCMVIMESGTRYERRKDQSGTTARRFHECKECHKRVYTNESNFQEYLKSATEKYRNK